MTTKKNNLQQYAESEDIDYAYILNQAGAIVKELNKTDYVSRTYIEEKMDNIKRFMDKFQQ